MEIKDPLLALEAATKHILPCLLAFPVQLYKCCGLLLVHLYSHHNQTCKSGEVSTLFGRLMDHWLNQRRVSFSDTHSRQHTVDDEHVTAIAAAAISIHSLDEAGLLNWQKMKESPKISRTKTVRGREGKISRQPSHVTGEISIKRSFGQELARTRETESVAFPVTRPSGISFPRAMSPAAGYQNNQGVPQTQHKNDKAKTWEKTKLERIQKRYEKVKAKILSWESERKIQAKQQMERKKREWEHKRAMEMQHYKNKIERIDKIAQGAIAQLEDHKRKQESKAREKAMKIRKTGKDPVKCFCFKSL